MRGRKGPSWEIQVDAPPEKVFAYVADLSTHPSWAMDDMTIQGDPGEARVGARYQAEGTLFNKRNPSTVTITAVDAPRSLEFEAEDASSITGHVFTFAPSGAGTLVRRQMYGVKQPLLGPVFLVIFRGAINKNFNGALEKLKANLEAPTA